jgi:hypothetical protein
MSDDAFDHVCKIERPLGAIQRLGDALALITETIEEPGASAINEIVWTMKDHISELDKIHEVLFRLHHPNREQFEIDGWPTNKSASKPETE